MTDAEAEEGRVSQERVNFDYIKGADFRAYRADGAIGGVTPNGSIHIALYNERHAIPRRLVHLGKQDGTLGAQLPDETISRDSIVRELCADVFVTYEVAVEIRDWLTSRINEVEERAEYVKSLRK